MKRPHLSRRLTKGTYRVVRVAVRLISALVLLIIGLCLFLSIYGLPDPLVRKVIQKANAAGLPIQTEDIYLTLKGWRLDQFEYYNSNPDELEPILEIRELFLNLRHIAKNEMSESGWGVKVLAYDVDLAPPKSWRINIYENSPFRHIDQIDVEVNLHPGQTVLSNGKAKWLGVNFRVNGSFIHEEGLVDQPDETDQDEDRERAPFFTGEQFKRWEDLIDTLSVNRGALADIKFTLNADDFSKTKIDLAVKAEEISYREIDFTKGEVLLTYAYPILKLDRARMFIEKQSIQVSSEYNVTNQELKSTLSNSITDKRLLTFLTPETRDWLTGFGLSIGKLPAFKVNLGPTKGIGLFNHILGEFSIQDAAYKDLRIGELRGKIKRMGRRLELMDLKGRVLDQDKADVPGASSMRGGAAEGYVFWDGDSREFGVKGDIQFDPNLLVGPLSRVPIATNVILRFSFKDAPPKVHLDLGAQVDDWSTFYIDTRALANDVAFMGVELTSLNITTAYKAKKLNLVSLAAMQGVDYTKGSALIDFAGDQVTFDLKSSMSFSDLETAIYPKSNLFEKTIISAGHEQLEASGIIEWGGKGLTDFKATVKTDHLNFPQAKLNNFVADITGKGPTFYLRNMEFMLYGGPGSGEFSIELDAKTKQQPYRVDVDFSKVNFDQFLDNYNTNAVAKTSGKLTGNIHCTADLTTNFLASARGTGVVSIEDAQLSDLPLFRGFSWLVRKVFPSFSVFSITSLNADYTLNDGVIASEKVYFGGTLISASAKGSYCVEEGFDAYVYARFFNESRLSKVVRLVTDPIMKFLQFKLEGSMDDPKWSLQKSPRNLFHRRKKSDEK